MFTENFAKSDGNRQSRIGPHQSARRYFQAGTVSASWPGGRSRSRMLNALHWRREFPHPVQRSGCVCALTGRPQARQSHRGTLGTRGEGLAFKGQIQAHCLKRTAIVAAASGFSEADDRQITISTRWPPSGISRRHFRSWFASDRLSDPIGSLASPGDSS